MPSRRLKIVNAKGLHARASARFVRCVEGHDATVTVSKDGETVDGASIMDLLLLAAAEGSEILVRAEGAQAAEVLDALEELVNDRFGEEE